MSIKVGVVIYDLLLNDKHFVAQDPIKLNNATNTCLKSLKIILCYS